MNKREFIAELWKQVDSLCEKLHIKCSKCLDMKRLWITMKDNETHHLVACCKCRSHIEEKPIPITKDDDFYGNIGEKRILLFEDKDDTPSSRLEILKEIDKEIQEREFMRMTNLLIKRDRDFADGSAIERFGTNRTKDLSRTLRHNHLQRDCINLLEHIFELHGYPWNKKHEIPIVFTWPDIHTRGSSWDIIEDENMHPIYFIITLQAQNYMNWLKIIDSCSLFSDEVHVQIKTYSLYPKNDAALEMCHRIVADIPRNQPLLDKLIL
jgi:hypothetical protein